MGMDLIPKNGGDGPHYNWSGWRAFTEFCADHGVDFEFAGLNDGDLIPAAVCRKIAAVIERHAAEYDAIFAGEHHGEHAAERAAREFRESGGMAQW